MNVSGLAITVAPPASAEVALAVAQRLHRQVQRDQRRRARRVQRDGRPSEPEQESDPAGRHARRGAGAPEAFGAFGQLGQRRDVVVRHHADEDARARAAQRPRADAGALQRLPRRLQQQPLLRVHGERLARADPEELRVERAGVRSGNRRGGCRTCPRARVRVVERVRRPSRGRRGTRRCRLTGRQQVPQLFRACVTPPGKRQPAPTIAIGSRDLPLQIGQTTAGLTQFGRRPLQVGHVLLFVRHRSLLDQNHALALRIRHPARTAGTAPEPPPEPCNGSAVSRYRARAGRSPAVTRGRFARPARPAARRSARRARRAARAWRACRSWPSGPRRPGRPRPAARSRAVCLPVRNISSRSMPSAPTCRYTFGTSPATGCGAVTATAAVTPSTCSSTSSTSRGLIRCGAPPDHLGQPAGDGEVAERVPLGQVTGAVPAVAEHGRRRAGLVVVAARHHVRPADPDLALLADARVGAGPHVDHPHVDAGDRQSPRGFRAAGRPADRHRAGGLGGHVAAQQLGAEDGVERLAQRVDVGGPGGEAHPQFVVGDLAAVGRPQQVLVRAGHSGEEGDPLLHDVVEQARLVARPVARSRRSSRSRRRRPRRSRRPAARGPRPAAAGSTPGRPGRARGSPRSRRRSPTSRCAG